MNKAASWLLSSKVTAPDRTAGYFQRPALTDRIGLLTDRPVTVLQAPSGFGKTTLLADGCGYLREQGVRVAWLTLDEDDTPDVFMAYLAYAFEHAGLNLSALYDMRASRSSSQPIHQQMGLLMRAVELHGAPCLLVLDEADQLPNRDAIAVIDMLLYHGPENFHVAVSCRANPGFDAATAVISRRGIVLHDADLRFSIPEMVQFFDGALSKREAAALAERTHGWPVAVRIYRNMKAAGDRSLTPDDLDGGHGVTADYCSARLLRGLSDEDRSFVYDVALFDWINPALVDEVLETGGSIWRLDTLPALNGFLQSDETNVRRLNPIVKDYCNAQLLRQDPDRFRQVHGRIARAMAVRGYLLPALRHAKESGDFQLQGAIFEQAGGLRLLLREGGTSFRAADRYLTPRILESYPRLALGRCIVLARTARFEQARTLYDDVRRRTREFTRDRDGGDDRALRIDGVIARSMLVGHSGVPHGNREVQELLAEGSELARDSELPNEIRGHLHALLGIAHFQRAQFEVSRSMGTQAEEYFTRSAAHGGVMFVDFHVGMVAMAQGRIEEAAQRYARGRRTAKSMFVREPGLTLMADVLEAELDLERNQVAAFEERASSFPGRLRGVDAWLDIYAAAYGVVADLAVMRSGADAARRLLDEAHEYALSLGLATVARYAAALRVSVLVAGGRAGQAEQAWRDDSLPDREPQLLDLAGQTWREMEALSSARIALLAARGDFDGARDLARRVCDVAAERGLVRTLMRGTAAAMAVEHGAGKQARALARMVEFLRLARATDYPRPLARASGASGAVLRALLDTDPGPDVKAHAEALLAQLAAPDPAPALSVRERDVLTGIARGEGAKEISSRISLTEDGVRYHLKRIYRKLHAGGRQDAVRRAQALGILAPPPQRG